MLMQTQGGTGLCSLAGLGPGSWVPLAHQTAEIVPGLPHHTQGRISSGERANLGQRSWEESKFSFVTFTCFSEM